MKRLDHQGKSPQQVDYSQKVVFYSTGAMIIVIILLSLNVL